MDAMTLTQSALARPFSTVRARVPWRLVGLCCLGYLLVLVAWSAPAPGPDEAPQPEYGIKAAFLYKFLSYVEWRPGTFAQPKSPVVIGVLGAADIAEALHTLVAGRTAGDRPVEVRRMRPGESLDGVHMLFVGHAEASRTAQLAPIARQRGVLLVTDFEGALDEGSAINLLVVDNRVRFEVSLEATEKSGLKLSSRMLAVALWVRPAH
jgi:hypothetical protein